jgi:tryptophan synthase alpha chain
MPLTFERKPAMVAYFTCGDPDLATTKAVVLAAIRAGADIIELGVPFSDPVADGPVIQRASDRALRQGTTLQDVLALAREVHSEAPDTGLIIFSYLNPILRYGLERFTAACADAGIDGALVTDLPIEEAEDYLRAMRARNLATVFLAAPTSTDERLQAIAEASTGFVYAVSRTGITGARSELPPDARELVTRLRRFTDKPIAVGFGISQPEHFAAVGAFADAVVVGSALVHTIENSGDRAPQAVAELIFRLVGARNKQQALAGDGGVA